MIEARATFSSRAHAVGLGADQGVGPAYVARMLPFIALAITTTILWPEVARLPTRPNTPFVAAGGVWLVIGVGFWALTIRRFCGAFETSGCLGSLYMAALEARRLDGALVDVTRLFRRAHAIRHGSGRNRKGASSRPALGRELMMLGLTTCARSRSER